MASSVTAIFCEFLHSSYAKIPRKQRFKGNHCWKLALFNEKVLHIERGAGKAGASTDILDFISWEGLTGSLGNWGYDSGVGIRSVSR